MELKAYDTIVVAMTASGRSSPTMSVIVPAILWKKGTTSICERLGALNWDTGLARTAYELGADATLKDTSEGEDHLGDDRANVEYGYTRRAQVGKDRAAKG